MAAEAPIDCWQAAAAVQAPAPRPHCRAGRQPRGWCVDRRRAYRPSAQVRHMDDTLRSADEGREVERVVEEAPAASPPLLSVDGVEGVLTC